VRLRGQAADFGEGDFDLVARRGDGLVRFDLVFVAVGIVDVVCAAVKSGGYRL
jgi:hypothetical protein